MVDATNANKPFGLVDCAANKAGQQFAYDAKAAEFQLKSDRSLCITVGPSSRQAGPFMSRDLMLEPCARVGDKFRQWVIRAQP